MRRERGLGWPVLLRGPQARAECVAFLPRVTVRARQAWDRGPVAPPSSPLRVPEGLPGAHSTPECRSRFPQGLRPRRPAWRCFLPPGQQGGPDGRVSTAGKRRPRLKSRFAPNDTQTRQKVGSTRRAPEETVREPAPCAQSWETLKRKEPSLRKAASLRVTWFGVLFVFL